MFGNWEVYKGKGFMILRGIKSVSVNIVFYSGDIWNGEVGSFRFLEESKFIV